MAHFSHYIHFLKFEAFNLFFILSVNNVRTRWIKVYKISQLGHYVTKRNILIYREKWVNTILNNSEFTLYNQ